jgi:hypothetical protein
MSNRARVCLVGVAVLLYALTTNLTTLPLLSADSDGNDVEVPRAWQLVWSADHETASDVQWYSPGGINYGGGEFNSGCAGTHPIFAVARSGVFSLQLTMAAPCGPTSSGTRMFRWREPRQYPNLYYRVWYFFPTVFTVTGASVPGEYPFWNILQWKSQTDDPQTSDAFFTVNVGNRPDGSMYLYLYDSHASQSYDQTIMDLPVGQWVAIEAVYKSRGDLTGGVTIWQDGTQLWDIQGVQTRYPDDQGGATQWSVNNYSNGVTPLPAVFAIDDAEIRAE